MKITMVKALRDVMRYKGRTFVTFLGILIGIASFGAVLSAYSILDREMTRNFMDTNPASMVFTVPNLDARAGELVKDKWQNTAIEVKKTVQARIARGDGTYGTIYLRAIENFEKQAVDTFSLERGSYPVSGTELALERDCLKILKNLKSGEVETIRIQLPGYAEKEMRISGIVHAPGLAPASMENFSYGFVSMDALKAMGYTGSFDEMRVVSFDNRFDLKAMKVMADEVKSLLTENGYAVTRMDVPLPGKHPHADQLSSLLFLLQAFTVISLLAASLIIINLMNFMMSHQIKQIAIQKAVGGSTAAISVPYFLYILLISLAALVLGIPIALAGSRGYAGFAAGILNFDIQSNTVPAWVFLAQILTGVLIPLLSAAWPIFKSCAIHVKDGLSEKVSSGTRGRAGNKERKSSLRLTFTLPLCNLLRKRIRTVLAIAALASGGMLFMVAQNMTASIDRTADASMDILKWDYDIRLAGIYDAGMLEELAGSIDNLEKAEVWQGATGFFSDEAGNISQNYTIKIVPPNSTLSNLPVFSSNNGIIINQGVADDENWMPVNGEVTLQVGAKQAAVTISEIVIEVPPMPTVYMSSGTFDTLFGNAPKQMIFARANTRDATLQRNITKDMESKFRAAGVNLSDNWNINVLRKAFIDHLKVIISFLSVIALFAVVVGGLGISSTIGINISERRHETGVLRAIGADAKRIYSLILSEVLIMGFAGWLIGTVLSYPVSTIVGNYFGQIFLHSDLRNILSISGSAVWLVISLTVALVSGYIPARKAAYAPLRDMLSYE
jgi:putative ABC transport system permease protein